MSAESEPSRHYPVACPKCSQEKGYPFQVRTLTDRPGLVEVRLRCRDCSHEWLEVAPSA